MAQIEGSAFISAKVGDRGERTFHKHTHNLTAECNYYGKECIKNERETWQSMNELKSKDPSHSAKHPLTPNNI